MQLRKRFASPVKPAVIWFSLIVDLLLVMIFAYIGRSSHALELTFAGVLQTAWPFIVALLLGWWALQIWRDPMGVKRGMLLWLIVIPVGHLLRYFTNSGNLSLPFIIVSAITLAVFLIGWRLIAFAIKKLDREPR